ncbi:MAG: response regulator [Thauera sp.]
MKVLIVDDNPINRLVPLAWLVREGCDITESVDGQDALAKAGTLCFDVVLLDLSMPGMSGREVCRALRALPDGGRLRIIAYTAHATLDGLDGFKAEGFDDVLIKPVSRETLLRAVLRDREEAGEAS